MAVFVLYVGCEVVLQSSVPHLQIYDTADVPADLRDGTRHPGSLTEV